jgi:predicted DNA-binding transcriptional regulator AlpA
MPKNKRIKMQVAFQNLDLIPKLLEKIDSLENQIKSINNTLQVKYDLTRLKDVCLYLGVSRKTIYNYIDDGRFKQNIHYVKTIKNNNVTFSFVESAIIKFKEGK